MNVRPDWVAWVLVSGVKKRRLPRARSFYLTSRIANFLVGDEEKELKRVSW